ncbi:MAG: hypothetical protein KDK70_01865 [Myxococcales bacterium]|nr:hypothetical protein [Myxococcales bacterium]
MEITTSKKWKIGSASRVTAVLSVERHQPSTLPGGGSGAIYAWFDVRVLHRPSLPSVVPLVYRLERLPGSPLPPHVTLDSLVVLTHEAAQDLFGSIGPVIADVSLGFRFRGVARLEAHLPSWLPKGLASTGAEGLAGAKGLADGKGTRGPGRPRAAWRWLPARTPTPTWILEAPQSEAYIDQVDGLMFDLSEPPPPPVLEVDLLAPAASTRRVGLSWLKKHILAPAHIELQRQQSGSWEHVGTLSSARSFEADPAEPFVVPSGSDAIEADLGGLVARNSRCRLRLATPDGAHEDFTDPFMVHLVEAKVDSPPAVADREFSLAWSLSPLPSEPATLELERYEESAEGGTWTTIGVLDKESTFVDPSTDTPFHPSSATGHLTGVSLGPPGEDGGQLRVSLRVEALGLVESSAEFPVPVVTDLETGTTPDGKWRATWNQAYGTSQIWLDSKIKDTTGRDDTVEYTHVVARRSGGEPTAIPSGQVGNIGVEVLEFEEPGACECVYIPPDDGLPHRVVVRSAQTQERLAEGSFPE